MSYLAATRVFCMPYAKVLSISEPTQWDYFWPYANIWHVALDLLTKEVVLQR